MVPAGADLQTPASPRLRRPPTKRRLIVQELRDLIVSGELAPGAQLPTRAVLAQRFEASSITIQDALDRLIEDGSVVAMGRHGTFVAKRPPHRFQYAIAFPSVPGSPHWARYWTALSNEAHNIQESSDRRFKFYHGVDMQPGNLAHQTLLADMRNQRLAGTILAFPPPVIQGSPIFAETSTPITALTLSQTYPGTPCIGLDHQSMVEKALDLLASQGAKRIACLMLPQMSEEFTQGLLGSIQARGMASRPQWLQAIPASPGRWVSQLTQLLMQGSPADRPDGLFVLDDNLVEHVSAGLVAAGMTGPSDVKVVAHCNFPWPTPSHLPIRRVGFDVRRTLDAACALVDARRAGRAVPEFTGISAVFDDEVEALHAQAVRSRVRV